MRKMQEQDTGQAQQPPPQPEQQQYYQPPPGHYYPPPQDKDDSKIVMIVVIIVILIVVGTVVGAAVLYVMTTGYMSGGSTPVSGILTYYSYTSDPENGEATFTLSMTTPYNPGVYDMDVTVLDDSGYTVWNADTEWIHIVSDSQHIQGGDRLRIDVPGTDISGYEVVISITGYSGSFGGRVPN